MVILIDDFNILKATLEENGLYNLPDSEMVNYYFLLNKKIITSNINNVDFKDLLLKMNII